MDRARLLQIAEQAEEAGEIEVALEAYQLLNSMPEESRPIDEKAAGAFETALSIGSSMIAEPVAGLAGIAQSVNPFAEAGAGANAVDATRQALTYQPRGEAGQEYMQNIGEAVQPVAEALEVPARALGDTAFDVTGSPAVAAGFYSLPTAALEVAGLKGGNVLSKIPKRKQDLRADEAAALQAEAQAIRDQNLSGQEPTQQGMTDAANVITKASDEDLQQLIQADPELYDAFDRLGVVGEIPSELVSTNPQYVELVAGLSSVPASQLKIPFGDVVEQIAKTEGRADAIIQDLGGAIDKADLSERYRESITDTVDDLYDAESAIYDNIDINVRDRTNPENTLRFIEQEIADVGGFDKLPPFMKGIYTQLKPKRKKVGVTNDLARGKIDRFEETPATYANFTKERKKVGSQIGKKVDQIDSFKGADAGKLKKLYAAMKEDQSNFMIERGFKNEIDAADQLTIKRKSIEDEAKSILGDKLEGSLSNIVESRIKGLARGEINKFKATIANISEDYRQEAVATALSGLLRGTGSGQTAFSANQVVKNLNELYRKPAALNALLKELPPQAKETLDALHKVSKQIEKVTNNKIKTGAIKLFDSDSGLIAKMAGKGLAAAAAKTTGSLATGNAINDILTSKTPRADAAAQLLASPQFMSMIRQSISGGVVEGSEISSRLKKAESLIEQSENFKKWADTLSDNEKIQLANLGLIGFISKEQE